MDPLHFLGMEATSDPLRWRLPVTTAVSTPGRFLYGGAGLAAGIAAMESVTCRPTVWATAQYLTYAPTGSVLDFEVIVAASGRTTTQARAIGRLGDKEVLTVNGALGHRNLEYTGTWVEPPAVPPPEECPPQEFPLLFADSVQARVEHRVARGRLFSQLDGKPGDAGSAFWARVPGHLEPSAATLAIIGDYVSGATSQPLGVRTMGRSLDNTLRVARLVPSEWVLCDIHMQALAHGFAHGLAHLWGRDGTLLGTASQSIGVRLWSDDELARLAANARAATGDPDASDGESSSGPGSAGGDPEGSDGTRRSPGPASAQARSSIR